MGTPAPLAVRQSLASLCGSCAGSFRGLCHGLDGADQFALSEASSLVRLPARGAVFREGDRANAVFTLVDGAAKLLRTLPDGRQQIIGFRFPGDLIGFTARERYPCDAELVCEATVCRVDRGKLEAMSRGCSGISHRLLQLCAEDLAAAQEQLAAMAQRSSEGRVAAFLLMLRDATRRNGGSGLDLSLPMTRADIGDYLGLTIESVSRVFAAFRRGGLLREPSRGEVRLLDMPGLEALATGEGAH
ncbi:Crp/Fnr family transcriptional regulator [Belnapia sp. F-4-1]|uniref:Crp/Fnr family transcriptional regulator n=1 Tax=Belnapia sp. F-4-1 TaxID=1545443 RepID=UPI001364CA83|nr:Crp/Fnr family transcriptional regulator [Belnapia sp. F-4-1]